MTVEEVIKMLQRLPIEDQRAEVVRLITHPGHVGPITGLEVRRTKCYRVNPDGSSPDDVARAQVQVVIR